MKYLTDNELKQLKRLERQLRNAVSHSKKAVSIGRKIAGIYQQAHVRNNPPNPMIDRAMKQLAKDLGIQ